MSLDGEGKLIIVCILIVYRYIFDGKVVEEFRIVINFKLGKRASVLI